MSTEKEDVERALADLQRHLEPIDELQASGRLQAVVVIAVAGEGDASTMHQETLGNVWLCNAIIKMAADKNEHQLLANLIVANQIQAQRQAMAEAQANSEVRQAMGKVSGHPGRVIH